MKKEKSGALSFVIFCIAIWLLLMLVGKIGESFWGEEAKLIKEIEEYMDEGNLSGAFICMNDLTDDSPKKMKDLHENLRIFFAIHEELGKYDEAPDIEAIENALDEMNNSYKKYEYFEYSVEQLEDRVKAIKEYRKEIEKDLDEADKLMEAGKENEAKKIVEEHYQNDLLEYVTDEQKSRINEYRYGNYEEELNWWKGKF